MPKQTTLTASTATIEEAWEVARKHKDIKPAELKDGVHYDLTFLQYQEIPAINISSLKVVKHSLAAYKLGMGTETTSALRFGSFAHTGTLEPDKLHSQYVVLPDSLADNILVKGEPAKAPKQTSEYKARKAAFMEKHPGKQEVSQEWFDNTLAMLRNLTQNDRTECLFSGGKPEVTLLWTDSVTKLRCKARVDWLSGAYRKKGSVFIPGTLCDLKTCDDCTDFNLTTYDYYMQAAWYVWGWRMLHPGTDIAFYFIPIEKTSPFSCTAAPIDDLALTEGEVDNRYCLNLVAKARKTNEWPHPTNPATFGLAKYHDREWKKNHA